MTAFDYFIVEFRSIEIGELIYRLIDLGLLRHYSECIHCSHPMKLCSRLDVLDKFAWRCNNINCFKYQSHQSIRNGSFFEFFPKTQLKDVFSTIFYFSQEKSISTVVQDFEISETVAISIYNQIRETISVYLFENPIQLGGEWKLCQIDESMFCHKVKAHKGRSPKQQVWVFGICELDAQPSRNYMQVVDQRNAETLLPIIKRVCKPDTIIHSDEWAAYNKLEEITGFQHDTVNHTFDFVDPKTWVHTQNIESCWNRQKCRIKKMKGVMREKLPSYLDEFMWRDLVGKPTCFPLYQLLRKYYH